MSMDAVDKFLLATGVIAVVVAGYFIFDTGAKPSDNSAAKSNSAAAKNGDSANPDNDADTAAKVEALRKHVTELNSKPEHSEPFVKVQHLLVGFKKPDGSITAGGDKANRTKDQAERLAADLYSRALAGEDFDALVKQYTNDSHPGIYGMTNTGVDASAYSGGYSRSGMVAAFGETGWRLKPGEIGVAPHDDKKSPFGWHIVKRVE